MKKNILIIFLFLALFCSCITNLILALPVYNLVKTGMQIDKLSSIQSTEVYDANIFFEVGTSESQIFKIKNTIEDLGYSETIIYTNSQQATNNYKKYIESKENMTITNINELPLLPASLDIKLKNYADLLMVKDFLKQLKADNNSIQEIILYGEKI